MFGAQQPPAHAPVKPESPELQQARAKLAQLELLLKQGKTILQELRAQAGAATRERDELRGQLDELRAKLELAAVETQAARAEKTAAIAQRDGFVAATEEAVAAMEAAVAERDAALTERDAAVSHLDAALAEANDATGKRDEMSLLLNELRADRDRVADELKSAESRRAALEEQLGAAAGDVELLRADAERARTLAREIVEIYKPA